MGSQVGIEWDAQTCGIHTLRLVGCASLSVQQVNRSPSQLKNTPGLGSNPRFQIVRRPCFHGATARPYQRCVYSKVYIHLVLFHTVHIFEMNFMQKYKTCMLLYTDTRLTTEKFHTTRHRHR